MSLADGTVLSGRYRIVQHIGSGGMGDVYRAFDHALERDVAIKLLTERSDEITRRFLAEAQAMARLSHPNIVAVFDVGVDGAASYIVMQYVKGATIRDVDRNAHTVRDAVTMVIDVLEALRYAHERDVVHRDVKPSNVIIAENGSVYVTDFGLARRMSDVGNLSQSSEIVGTIAYLPPERFMGKTGDRTSDLYSVGVLLYELVTGALPFAQASEDLVSTMIAHVNDVPKPARLLNPSVPPELERIIARMLESEPKRRFADAGVVIEALASARDGAGARANWSSALPAPAPALHAPARSVYAEALAIMERGIEAGRSGDAAAAQMSYRDAIDRLARVEEA